MSELANHALHRMAAQPRDAGWQLTHRNLLFSRAWSMPERVGLIKVRSAGIGPGKVCYRLRLPADREPATRATFDIDVIQTSALIRTRRSGRLTAGREAFLP